MPSEVLSESVLESERMSEVKNEIAAIRDRLQEAKGIANAVRGTWKEIANNKRQADEGVVAMTNEGYGVPSVREIDAIKAARWSSMESHVVALRKFIDVANGTVDTIDELVHHSKVDLVAWVEKAVAELMAAMPGFTSPVAKSRVADLPQSQEGHKLIHDTQRQAASIRQLIKDAQAAIASTESEMVELSRKWRAI